MYNFYGYRRYPKDFQARFCVTFEGNMKLTTKEKSTMNRNYILAVCKKVCHETKYPKKNDYVKEIAIRRTKDENILGEGYKAEDIRSGISRAIDRLVEDGEFICLYGRYYVPNKGNYKAEHLSLSFYEILKGKVKIVKREILIVSYNMCAVLIEPVGDIQVKELLKKCLGDSCFHILKSKSLLYIMLKEDKDKMIVPDKSSEEFILIKAIGMAIARLYDEQKNNS